MIYLFCLLVPYLLGKGVLRAFYGKCRAQDMTLADSVLTGGMVVIGLAEAAHLGAVALGRSFSDCKKMFLAGLVLLLFAAAILIVIEQFRKKKDKLSEREAERLWVQRTLSGKTVRTGNQILYFVFGAVVLIQLLLIVTEQKVYLTGDMTAETVNSILDTDAIYQVNPLTGQPYTLGMPLRLKILCLPTLYAICCDLFGMSAVQVVWTVVPALTLLGCYLSFYTVARALFTEDVRKRGIFMLFAALLLWVGDYMYGMDGFGVQYAGFRGVSIRMAVLLPYTFGLVLRRKWKLAFLCILAEACIVWTLYGMGICLLVTVGMLLAGLVTDKLSGHQTLKEKSGAQQGGEEDSL